MQFQYYKINAHFRGEQFEACIRIGANQELTLAAISELIQKSLRTTIPAAEISSDKETLFRGEYNAFEGKKFMMNTSGNIVQQ